MAATLDTMTVMAAVQGDPFDGVTPAPFEGAVQVRNDGAQSLLLVAIVLPPGVIIGAADADGLDHDDLELIDDELDVHGLVLRPTATVLVSISGMHVLADGTHRVTALFRTPPSWRSDAQRSVPTLLQVWVDGGFVVDRSAPPCWRHRAPQAA
jgi:hypothetical protein